MQNAGDSQAGHVEKDSIVTGYWQRLHNVQVNFKVIFDHPGRPDFDLHESAVICPVVSKSNPELWVPRISTPAGEYLFEPPGGGCIMPGETINAGLGWCMGRWIPKLPSANELDR